MPQELSKDRLRLTPLGGFGEIGGLNMLAYEYGDEMFLIDSGLMFPDDDMFGVDMVIPNITYIKERRHKLKAILITHGHEDHIGALPYVLPELPPVPIYASKLTHGLIAVKLKEHHLLESAQLRVIQPREVIKISKNFSAQCYTVRHSIPGSMMFAIKTPPGIIAHTGDFKVDLTPVDGIHMDFASISSLGEKGVLLALSDSTNAEVPGLSGSEAVVRDSIFQVFEESAGRIIVATFASNIVRVQQIIQAAYRQRRKVAIVGRSLANYTNIAIELGYLNVPPNTLVKVQALQSLPDDKVTIIATGSQGEERSVLTRMAEGIHPQIKLRKGDTVIISASPIPGNEGSVHKVINKIYGLGARVIHSKTNSVHASGHGCQEDLKFMLALLRPKYFMPMHGEQRHLVAHGELAKAVGVNEKNIIIAESGNSIEIDDKVCKIVSKGSAGKVLVDGLGVGDIGNVVLSDRKAMANAGTFVIVVVLDKKTGKLISEPQIITRGFVFMKEAEQLLEDAKKEVRKIAEAEKDAATTLAAEKDFQKKLRERMAEYLYEKTARRPVVLAVISRV